MAITLDTTVARVGFPFVGIVQGRTGTIALTTNPGYRWQFGASVLYCDDVRIGDTPVLTETVNGVSTAYPFAVTLFGVASTLAISGRPTDLVLGSSAGFEPLIVGGVPPYTLRLTAGVLPVGRSISGLAVVGTYLSSGPNIYQLEVADSTGTTARLTVSAYVQSKGVRNAFWADPFWNRTTFWSDVA